MTFQTERCSHGMLYTVPCPECIQQAMERLDREREKNRDLVNDELRHSRLPSKPFSEE